MVFKDEQLVAALNKEFTNSEIVSWAEFIEAKDLGVIYVGYDRDCLAAKYRVTCKKKFFLTKIKYGLVLKKYK